MNYGLKLIAKGIALTHQDRLKLIENWNDLMDSYADGIRSSSDVDGMPHGNVVTDPVSSRAIKIESLAIERDREQDRVNAVEWAMQYATDLYAEEDAKSLREAVFMYLKGDRDEAIRMVASNTTVPIYGFNRVRGVFLEQIIKYLHFYKL